MSGFEQWFKTTSAYRMLESMNYYKMDLFHWVEARGEYRHTSVQIAFMTWAEQQAKIDQLNSVLNERTKEWLQAIDCGIYFENVAKPLKAENDALRTQLNNMEQCCIGAKKERDDLQNSLDELIKHDTRIERKQKAAVLNRGIDTLLAIKNAPVATTTEIQIQVMPDLSRRAVQRYLKTLADIGLVYIVGNGDREYRYYLSGKAKQLFGVNER